MEVEIKETNIRLKKCPFCGGTPIKIVDDETESFFGIKCFNCNGCISAEKETLNQAIEAWNKRV